MTVRDLAAGEVVGYRAELAAHGDQTSSVVLDINDELCGFCIRCAGMFAVHQSIGAGCCYGSVVPSTIAGCHYNFAMMRGQQTGPVKIVTVNSAEKKSDRASRPRRLQRLRVAFKLMLAVAFCAIVVVGFAQFGGRSITIDSTPQQRVHLGDIAQGQLVTVLWEGRPVLVYRRTLAETNALKNAPGNAMGSGEATEKHQLVDPDSKKSLQPAHSLNPWRSSDPEWFVAINQGTDFGCTLQLTEQQLLVDTCRGSRYDLAGRVLKAQIATKNISVPAYTITGEVLVLGASGK